MKKSSNQKDWEKYLSDPSDIFDKDDLEKKNQKIFNKFKFDFHGYSIVSANKKIEDLISKSFEKGVSELLIITGKGIHSNKEDDVYASKEFNKLQNTLPEFLKNNQDLNSKISSIRKASKELGGDGALVIKLKNKF